jgi:hypothetical protein
MLPKSLNNIQKADQFAGATASEKITACLAAAGNGGVCDATGFVGPQTVDSCPEIGIGGIAQTLIANSSSPFVLSSSTQCGFKVDNNGKLIGATINIPPSIAYTGKAIDVEDTINGGDVQFSLQNIVVNGDGTGITAYSGAANVYTLTMNNSFQAGQPVTFWVLSGPTALDKLTLNVSATGLSSTSFQVPFPGASGSGAVLGMATAGGYCLYMAPPSGGYIQSSSSAVDNLTCKGLLHGVYLYTAGSGTYINGMNFSNLSLTSFGADNLAFNAVSGSIGISGNTFSNLHIEGALSTAGISYLGTQNIQYNTLSSVKIWDTITPISNANGSANKNLLIGSSDYQVTATIDPLSAPSINANVYLLESGIGLNSFNLARIALGNPSITVASNNNVAIGGSGPQSVGIQTNGAGTGLAPIFEGLNSYNYLGNLSGSAGFEDTAQVSGGTGYDITLLGTDGLFKAFCIDFAGNVGFGSVGFDVNGRCWNNPAYVDNAGIFHIKSLVNSNGPVIPQTALGYQGPAAGYVQLAVNGTTGTITGTALTATCDSGTASVTGAVVGHPVVVSSTTGADVGGAFNLRASVTATNTVTVYVCGTGTPASLAYNVTVF